MSKLYFDMSFKVQVADAVANCKVILEYLNDKGYLEPKTNHLYIGKAKKLTRPLTGKKFAELVQIYKIVNDYTNIFAMNTKRVENIEKTCELVSDNEDSVITADYYEGIQNELKYAIHSIIVDDYFLLNTNLLKEKIYPYLPTETQLEEYKKSRQNLIYCK